MRESKTLNIYEHTEKLKPPRFVQPNFKNVKNKFNKKEAEMQQKQAYKKEVNEKYNQISVSQRSSPNSRTNKVIPEK